MGSGEERNMNLKSEMVRRPAGERFLRAAGVFLCVILAGCGKADRALSLPVGEPVTCAAERERGEVLEESASGRENASERESESVIYVHVCGAVNAPGVVPLPEGSRGQDALDAAGGFAEDAAMEAVNLAAVLSDGMKLYFPTRDEAVRAESGAGEDGGENAAGRININTADEGLLRTLPGIGEAKAGAIVSYREENGAFENPEDIMRVPGIKESAYGKIKEFITVK